MVFPTTPIPNPRGGPANLIPPANAASGIEFESAGFGSRQFVSIQAQSGSFATVDTAGGPKKPATGRDAVATANGAVTVGDGNSLEVTTSSLDADLTLDKTIGQASTSFVLTGGGPTLPPRP